MKRNKLFLAAALAAGTFAFAPLAPLAPRAMAKERSGDTKDSEVQVKYDRVPKAVKETLDKERGSHDVKSIMRVERDGRVFFRATIDTKGADKVVRIAEDGGVLSEGATADTSAPARTARPAATVAEEPKGTAVDYDRLPGPVRAGIAKAAGSSRVKAVYRDGDTYRAEIGNNERNWAVLVDGSGKVLKEVENTQNSKIVASYDHLPGAVKAAVMREAGAPNRIGKVMQISRNKDTYYRVEILDQGTPRWITVNDDGKPVDYTPKK